MSQSEVSTLSTGAMVYYGLGGAVYAVKEAAYTMFVLFFYTQVLGLSGAVTGLVLFISLLWDAVSDPLVGVWSDRLRSRWGRRHPFMVASALPLGLGFLALFAPPRWVLADPALLAAWLLGCSLWIRTAVTVFTLPHLALAAEITRNYHERSRLLGVRVAILFLATLLLASLSLHFLFGESAGQDGRFVIANYVDYGLWSALVVWSAAAVTTWGTRRFIASTRVADGKLPASSGLRGMLGEFIDTFRNINFRNLLFYDIAASSSYGIMITLNVLALTYFWELSASETGLMMALPVIVAVPLGLLTLGPLGRRWPKHRILNGAMLLMLLDVLWLYPLRLLELIPANGHPLVLVLLFLQNGIFMYLFVLRIVAAFSITADVTDEHEAASGKRQEGGFYSALTFTTKLASSIGPLYGGVALDLIGLKEGMLPGQVSEATLHGLVWVSAVGILPLMIIAWLFTFRISMSEARLLEVQQQINARPAD